MSVAVRMNLDILSDDDLCKFHPSLQSHLLRTMMICVRDGMVSTQEIEDHDSPIDPSCYLTVFQIHPTKHGKWTLKPEFQEYFGNVCEA